MDTSQQITVDIWSDLVCPWCWIAKTRFEKALVNFAHKDKVQVNTHPYRIATNFSPAPFEKALRQKFGSDSHAKAMMRQVQSAGLQEGLTYNFDQMQFGDTIQALILVEAAKSLQKDQVLLDKLYYSSITEGKSLFDPASLIQLAEEVGIDPDFTTKALNNPAYQDQVIASEKQVQSFSVSGVPLFIFNHKYMINGAQATSMFEQVLNDVYQEMQPVGIAQGASCDINGCK